MAPARTLDDIRNDPFLDKARKRFKYCFESWKDIYEEGDVDINFLAGDSWEGPEKRRRTDKKIPMPHMDELSQYINQLINDVRQNKRSPKVEPMGSIATDKSAEIRENWIRAVEYASSAQTAYITAFDSQVSRSFGFWRLETCYENDDSFNLTARIKRIANPKTIFFDPDCKEYTCEDAEDCFEIDFWPIDKFKREYPKAAVLEFTDDVREIAPDWIQKERVQVASWWKVELTPVTIHQVRLEDGSLRTMRKEHLPAKMGKAEVIKTREVQERRIVQHILNGVEELETNDPKDGKGWPGQWIPIIPVWGKELYRADTSGTRRELFSYIRLARDPQRLLNYHVAQEIMEAKMSPRAPYMGPKGMFSEHADQWERLNDDPTAYVEYSIPEGFQPGQIAPQRIPFVPNFQQYEIAKESAKRAIQAAMGISPLPTPAQRANEKSGIALERIRSTEQLGSFHFIDNFERSLDFNGRQLDDVFPKLNDTKRKLPQRDAQNAHSVIDFMPQTASGDHQTTIAVGPSYDSQRQEAQAFMDTLANVPGAAPLILDLIVKARDLGPLGDEMAERLTPPQFAQLPPDLPPAVASMIGQMRQQLQTAQAAIAQMSMEKKAKAQDNDVRLKIAALQEQTKIIIAQATLQKESAETILQNEYARIQSIFDTISDMATAAHQADLDKAVAAHAASLPQPAMAAGSTNGNGGGTQ